ncbi:MAG: glycosyltransferase family 4 protein, partial [Pirellulales bacterium]|nr:glycosyltransferase family 4 protein [Pirellulales bacterium]
MKRVIPPLLHLMRQWDAIAARRPDVMLTNSRTSQQRIRRYYQRDAEVIAPPVDIERIPFSTKPGS